MDPAYAIDPLCHGTARLHVRATTTSLDISVADQVSLLEVFTWYHKDRLEQVRKLAQSDAGTVRWTTFGCEVAATGGRLDIDPADADAIVAQIESAYTPTSKEKKR